MVQNVVCHGECSKWTWEECVSAIAGLSSL